MLLFLLLCTLLVVVLLMVGFARLSVLSSRIADLERKLRAALDLITDIRRERREPGTAAEEGRKDTGGRQKKRPAQPRRTVGGVKTAALPPAESQPAVVSREAPAPLTMTPRVKSRTKEEWEALIGGKLLNRIGALALILGFGFFLQYAFANDMISEPVRVMIGFALGLALVAGAAKTASGGFQVFAQGLVGAGIAILYLSVYASFEYYRLVSQPVAFLLMSAVTVITFTQAFRYDSVVVALLGWLGGFLTPFLLSTGEVNPVGLFSYLALLNLGLLVAAWRKDSWSSIEPLSMGATYLIYAIWLAESYAESSFLPGLLFLILFWVMFHALHAARLARGVSLHRGFRLTMASIHGLVFYLLLYILFNQDYPEWRVPATIVVALLYAAFALVARRRSGLDGEFLHLTLTAIALVVIATLIQFKGMALVQYWTAEALALSWVGVQWKLRPVYMGGVALFGLAFLALFGAPGALIASTSEHFTLLVNRRAFTFALLAVSLGLSGGLIGKMETSGSATLRTILHVAWCWILFILVSVETIDAFAQLIRDAGVVREQYIQFLRTLTLPAVWGAYALPLIFGGTRRAFRPVVVSGLLMLLCAVCLGMVRGLVFAPISDFVPVLNLRVVVLLVIIAECVIAHRFLSGAERAVPGYGNVRVGLQAAVVLLSLVVLTGEIWDYFAHDIYRLALAISAVSISEELSRLQNLRQLFLSTGWLVYSIVLMVLGLWKRTRLVRIEAIVLFGVSILKIFIYDLSFLDTRYRIFSFVGLGIILLAVSYLYQRYRDLILGPVDAGGRSTGV